MADQGGDSPAVSSEHVEVNESPPSAGAEGAASGGAAGEGAAAAGPGFDVSSLLDRKAISGRAEDAMQFFENYVTDERARKAVEDLRSRLSAGGHDELARVVQQAQEQGKTLLAELQEENQSLADQLSSGQQTLREVVGGEERVTQLTDTGKSMLTEHSGALSSVHHRLRDAMSKLSQDEETAHLRDEGLTVMRDLARHRTTQELVQRAKRMVLESEEVRNYVNSVLGSAGEAVSHSPDQYSERARAAIRSYAKDERTQQLLQQGLSYLQREDVSQLVRGAVDGAAERGPDVATQATEWISRSEGYLEELQKHQPELMTRGRELLQSTAARANKALDDLDADTVSEWGERMAKDPVARAELLDQIQQAAVGFVLDQLPSIEVPPIDGEKDRVKFNIDGLDLSGFRIQRENVKVRLGDFRATGHILNVEVTDIAAAIRGLKWQYEQLYFPYMTGQGAADADISGGSITLDLSLRRKETEDGEQVHLTVARFAVNMDTIALRISESVLSGIYNVLASLFRDMVRLYIARSVTEKLQDNMQTLLVRINQLAAPYGPMLLSLAGVSIDALETERDVDTDMESLAAGEVQEGEPLQSGQYEVTFHEEGALGMTLDNDPHDDNALYVAAFARAHGGRMGLAESCGRISVSDRVIAVNNHSVQGFSVLKFVSAFSKLSRPVTLRFQAPPEKSAAQKRKIFMKSVGIEFLPGPVGLTVKSRRPDSSAHVIGFQRRQDGSLLPAEMSGAIRRYDVITSINRRGTLDLTFDQTMNLFKTAQRPMRVEFARSSDLRVQLDARKAPLGLRLGLVSTDASEPGEDAVVGPTVRCVVMGFEQRVGAAESSGVIIPGHVLQAIGDTPVADKSYDDVLQLLRSAPRPVWLRFGSSAEEASGTEEEVDATIDLTEPDPEHDSTQRSRARTRSIDGGLPTVRVRFGEGPFACVFAPNKVGACYIRSFPQLRGAAEACEQVVVGDVLMTAGGRPVEGLGLAEIQELLRQEAEINPDAVVLVVRDMDQHQQIWPEGVRIQAINEASIRE